VDADLHAEVVTAIDVETPKDAEHLDGEIQGPLVVVEIGHGEAAHRQVAVADGFHLLQAKLLRQIVERAHQVVEDREGFVGAQGCHQLGEALEIGEQHGHIAHLLGDLGFPPLQPAGNRRREHAEEQSFILLILLIHQLRLGLQALHHAVERLPQLPELIFRLQIGNACQLPRGHLAGAVDELLHRLHEQMGQGHGQQGHQQNQQGHHDHDLAPELIDRCVGLRKIHLGEDHPLQPLDVQRGKGTEHRHVPVVVHLQGAGFARQCLRHIGCGHRLVEDRGFTQPGDVLFLDPPRLEQGQKALRILQIEA